MGNRCVGSVGDLSSDGTWVDAANSPTLRRSFRIVSRFNLPGALRRPRNPRAEFGERDTGREAAERELRVRRQMPEREEQR